MRYGKGKGETSCRIWGGDKLTEIGMSSEQG